MFGVSPKIGIQLQKSNPNGEYRTERMKELFALMTNACIQSHNPPIIPSATHWNPAPSKQLNPDSESSESDSW